MRLYIDVVTWKEKSIWFTALKPNQGMTATKVIKTYLAPLENLSIIKFQSQSTDRVKLNWAAPKFAF